MKMQTLINIDVIQVFVLYGLISIGELLALFLMLFWETGLFFDLSTQINFLKNVSFNLIFELKLILTTLAHLKLDNIKQRIVIMVAHGKLVLTELFGNENFLSTLDGHQEHYFWDFDLLEQNSCD